MAGYHAKKRLGQNFLISEAIITGIIEQIAPRPGLKVIEIGPGRGALTLPLAESGADILAIEFDRDLIGYLRKLLRNYENAEVCHADFLTFQPDPESWPCFVLTGNLPFNITSPVIDWCVKYAGQIKRAVFMVQQELAARLAAQPGSRDWSPLSILTQRCFSVENCFRVPPSSFRPAPKVTSAVVVLTPHERSMAAPSGFDQLVRAAFVHRRKTLINNLVPEVVPSADVARMIFDELGIDPDCRAEQMSIERFLNLTNYLRESKLL